MHVFVWIHMCVCVWVNCFHRTKSHVNHWGAIPPLTYSLFHHWWEWWDTEQGGKYTDEIFTGSHIHTTNTLNFCTQPHTHHLMFLHVSTGHQGNGFSLTSRMVSLQHVAMATENLLKGLTTSPVFERKVFMWWYLQIWTGSPPKMFVLSVCLSGVACRLTCFCFFSFSVCLSLYVKKKRLSRGQRRTGVRMNGSKITECYCLHGCRSLIYF